MQNPDLILFDWDRTLCDIEGPTNDILKETFRIYWNTVSYPEFIKIFRSSKNQGRKFEIVSKRYYEKPYEKITIRHSCR